MVNCARHQKQCCLVERVDQHKHHGGLHGQGGVQSNQKDQHPQDAYGRVSEDALEITLWECQYDPRQHRGGPSAGDKVVPRVVAAEHRAQPGEQVNTRLDHGRGVQVCAYRRRSFHGPRKPEVEWELG